MDVSLIARDYCVLLVEVQHLARLIDEAIDSLAALDLDSDQPGASGNRIAGTNRLKMLKTSTGEYPLDSAQARRDDARVYRIVEAWRRDRCTPDGPLRIFLILPQGIIVTAAKIGREHV